MATGVSREDNPELIQPEHETFFEWIILCERFGWTLDEVKALGVADYLVVVAMITGIDEARQKDE
jgi:hypothetical protein